MQFHEAANIFPLMEGEEFQALVEDIRQNGQREPIWTYEGKILDGRNRYSAILRLQERKVEIEPVFREWDGKSDVVAFVVSLNLHRRHLSESQRAMIADSLASKPKGRQKKNAPIGALSQSGAAELMGVSRREVQRAAAVRKHGDDELVEAVKGGELSVSAAARVVEAAERYPELRRLGCRPRDRATMAENLDRLPEPEREEKLARVRKGDDDTITQLANKPPMPKKRPPSAEDLWRDFFDDSERTLARLTANFEEYYREWEYSEKEWFLNRLKDFVATLDDLEATALRSMDYDEGTEGAVSTSAVH